MQEAEAVAELAREEMNQYQQMENRGAIAILQIKEKEQAFKAAVARLERVKAAMNASYANVSIITLKSFKTSPCPIGHPSPY
ncbi:hypothetical protein KBT16_13190 [Nostoc sp. CCCryo 231-06]|nr:hypothetical protein [Nostoc sp. CCCryo 231-06]